MNNEITIDIINYIETPKVTKSPEKIDVLLEKRMLEFMLARRQREWIEGTK